MELIDLVDLFGFFGSGIGIGIILSAFFYFVGSLIAFFVGLMSRG